MAKPLYPNEQSLFIIACIIAGLLWAALIAGTRGSILVVLCVFYIFHLFFQSGFISYLRGTGALISENQFPDIQERIRYCAQMAGLKNPPAAYIMNGNGLLNAFATRFLRKDYLILLSDVLDALEDHPEAINFYIGHEMGHIDRKHILYEPFLSLALVLPLLGAAYSRARETTCDMYGAMCCSPQAAQQGLTLLAVGAKRYKTINLQEYLRQVEQTSGFWMSLHELIGSYPWLVKRVARVSPEGTIKKLPSRNPFAYLFAAFVPRISLLTIVIIYTLIIISSLGGIKGAAEEKRQKEQHNMEEEYQQK